MDISAKLQKISINHLSSHDFLLFLHYHKLKNYLRYDKFPMRQDKPWTQHHITT